MCEVRWGLYRRSEPMADGHSGSAMVTGCLCPCSLSSRPRLAHCTLAPQCPWWWVAGGTVRLVTLIVWWHGPYWVMINYPISWMGFHNTLLIVSSSTPTIVLGLSNNRNSICVTFSMSEGKIRHNLSTASIKADISYLNQKIFSWLVGFQWYKLPLTTLISLIRNLQFIPGLARPWQTHIVIKLRVLLSSLLFIILITSRAGRGSEHPSHASLHLHTWAGLGLGNCKANPHAFILPIILSPGKDIYVCQFRTIV